LIQVPGCLIAHQFKARPAAVAESGDGGLSAEPAFQRRHWRGGANRRGLFPPPPVASSPPSLTNSGNPPASPMFPFIYSVPFAGLSGRAGWDFCTGVGTVQGKAGK